MSKAINLLKTNKTPTSKSKPSKLINSAYGPKTLNKIFQYSNKDYLENNEFINNNMISNYKNKKNNYSYNKVIKVNRTYNRDSNNNFNQNESEKSLNVNEFRNHKRYSVNFDTKMHYEKYNSKSNNNSNNCSFNKFIKNKEGEMQLFNKKNKPISLQSNRLRNNGKIKSRQQHKNKYLNHEYNTTNKILNHFLVNNINNYKNKTSCLNYNKPIRLNYNNDSDKYNKYKDIIINQYNNDNDIYDNIKKNKINYMKKKLGFEGNNNDFIGYLKIIKLKADITNFVEKMFNVSENLNEKEIQIQSSFYRLENLIDDNNYENENLLKIYQYLAEQLLIANNINKNNFS